MKHKSTLPVAALREFLRVAAPVLPRRTSMPVLGCVQVGSRRLAATDLDVAVAMAMPEADGPLVCLHATPLRDFLKTVDRKQATVELCIDGSQVCLDGITIPSVASEEAPPVPERGTHADWQPFPELAVAQLMAALDHASTEESRYILQGVYFDAAEGRMVGTDGRRLYRSRKFHWHHLKRSFILPEHGIWRKLATSPGSWWVRTEETKPLREPQPGDEPPVLPPKAHFAIGDFTVCSKTIDGNYPRYQQVIPKLKDWAINWVTLPADFERAVAKASVGHDKGVSVKLVFGERGSSVQCNEKQATVVPFEPEIQGPGGMIAFKPDALLTAMKSAGRTLAVANEVSPGVFTDPADPEGEMAVIMPVRAA